MRIIDSKTRLPIGNPEVSPFQTDSFPDPAAISNAFSSLILSASGWRKVFAADGDEESSAGLVSSADLVIVAGMAKTFADFIREKTDKSGNSSVAVGIDARYTGPLLASVMIRVLISEGFSVRYLFIVAAPEIMAYVRKTPELDGFIYISASHNPVGYNGVKFGLNDGGVLGGADSVGLIHAFQEIAADRNRLRLVCRGADSVDAAAVESVFRSSAEWKREAADAYYHFTKEVVSNAEDPEEQERFFKNLREVSVKTPLGIVGELNGSARGTSIDRSVFKEAGFEAVMVNDVPRRIVHPIVPEGVSLGPCRAELAELAAENPAFQIGYVPDNDGDRGNLVYYDFDAKEARSISAQEVFAIAVLGELSFLSCRGGAATDARGRFTEKVAVAVNGPTSMRIDRIAEVFNAKVFRAEVGEANVVNLARRLRDGGYIVRILGEGSNGGNITYPSAVRDPLSTIFAAAKLLCLRDTNDGQTFPGGPFGLWLELSGQREEFLRFRGENGRTTVADVLRSLPSFVSTSAYEPEAIMRIRTTDHAVLKANYEKVFTEAWNDGRTGFAEKYGIVSWREINTEGTEEKIGFGPRYRSGEEKGGLKIQFYAEDGPMERPTAYIWMRGSGTEPVFRVLADVEGDRPEMERELLSWHRGMIERADRMSTA